jgi:hypothetical protein
MSQPPLSSTPPPVSTIPSGEGVRGEVAGCPTGLVDDPQAQQPQQTGGGGAPGTGSTPSYSPGEDVTEEQQ